MLSSVFSRSKVWLAAFTVVSICHARIPSSADAAGPQTVSGAIAPEAARKFLQTNCYDCHIGKEADAGLDLSALAEPAPDSVATGTVPEVWVRIFDRVHAGEMPPDDEAIPDKEVDDFVKTTGQWIREKQLHEAKSLGRVRGRRLTNLQLERTLHDLLGIDIPLASGFSDEQRVGGFTNVADGQSMSHFQLEQHLRAIDAALDEAVRRITTPADDFDDTFSPKDICKRRPGQRNREPELRDGLAAVWSSKLIFYGRMAVTTAKEDGWYRFTIKASSIKQPEGHGVWCSVRTGPCVSSAPLLETIGGFEATQTPGEWTFEGWLPEGHMLEVRPADATLKSARFNGGQVGAGEGEPQDVPGVAIHSVRMQRIHRGPDDEEIKQLLLGDLPVRVEAKRKWTVQTGDPKSDAARLMAEFAKRAFRRPVTTEEIKPYIDVVHRSLDENVAFGDAIRGGYRALLCSPRFLYFTETPGVLDDHAIATRLSYFLWNRMPDQTLTNLADAGKLRSVDVIRQQVRRMLADPRGRDFVVDFASQWLDLRDIDFTEPDPKTYRDFDPMVQQSMLQETHHYLQKMLDEDLSVRYLIDSDFAMLNSRLARFYEIPDVDGDQTRAVPLKANDRRGGLLTQGAILKVTANGTTTSPVIRGVWISERILGEHIAPPPQNVPAIEPDIRGATTIREQLAKHTANAECAVCHVKIDPPGFALENYDPSGKWRETYNVAGGKKSKLKVDPSNRMPTGESFNSIDDFKQIVLKHPDKLARGLAEKLVTYGTGATIGFADRQAIDQIVQQASANDYGMRSIVEAVATNILFVSK
jgi:mono/diheme cytochrome c family protein